LRLVRLGKTTLEEVLRATKEELSYGNGKKPEESDLASEGQKGAARSIAEVRK
jgi:hypothetical protein